MGESKIKKTTFSQTKMKNGNRIESFQIIVAWRLLINKSKFNIYIY
jgi:hypothetical protein